MIQMQKRRDWPRALPAGGDDGIRTHDPLLAGQVLSQLSYTPVVSIPFSLRFSVSAKLSKN